MISIIESIFNTISHSHIEISLNFNLPIDIYSFKWTGTPFNKQAIKNQ